MKHAEDAQRERDTALQDRIDVFRHEFAETLARRLGHPASNAPRVLFVSSAPPQTETELCLQKSLEQAGARTLPLIMMQPELLAQYYDLVRPEKVYHWRDYWSDPELYRRHATEVVQGCRTLDDLTAFQVGPARVGGHAVALTRRHLRLGTLDFHSDPIVDRLVYFLAASMSSAHAIRRVIDETRPTTVMVIDTVYSPKGEILDTCLHDGIPVIRWYPAHKSNVLMLKRYSSANRDHDLNSLSDRSWRIARDMPWSPQHREALDRELLAAYTSGDWYSESGTQFNTRLMEADAVRHTLRLDPSRKTAFIFPHISWDASFGRGDDLFESYEEWLVATVTAACENTAVQWVIRVHPAHVGKSEVDLWNAEPSEEAILRRRFERLPAHLSIIPAQSGISTHSLFGVMDYCLTVRGTVGLEAARLGIPVLTAGTGRYDRRGFTLDAATCEEHLDRVHRIQEIRPLTAEQVELADRYAYALFVMRPLALTSMTLEYDQSHGAATYFSRVHIRPRSASDWAKAQDLNAFADWVLNSNDEDFLVADQP